MSLAEPTKQSDSEEIDNNKDIRISIVRGRKIIITTASAIFVGGKLLMASTKKTLPKNEQDMKIKKV